MTFWALFYSAASAIVALTVMWAAIALLRGREREDELVTLVRTDCCHEYRGVADVVQVEGRPWLSFECKDKATCKRVINFKSAS